MVVIELLQLGQDGLCGGGQLGLVPLFELPGHVQRRAMMFAGCHVLGVLVQFLGVSLLVLLLSEVCRREIRHCLIILFFCTAGSHLKYIFI